MRSALALLLARPQLALEIAVPAGLEGVDKPGADVLRRMLDEVRRRPRITTAELLECFAGDPAHAPLVKLSLQELPGDEPAWREDLESALSRLIEQSDGDRRQYLLARQKSGDTLSSAEKNELRALLARRTQ
ncbi:MAG: hypothetical protein OMOMHJEC_01105 [Xanthomonadales bacterium]|nr:hypothetical protein [Xanthomonadales bacterium]